MKVIKIGDEVQVNIPALPDHGFGPLPAESFTGKVTGVDVPCMFTREIGIEVETTEGEIYHLDREWIS